MSKYSPKHFIQFLIFQLYSLLFLNYLCIIKFLNYLGIFFLNITHYKELSFTVATEKRISNKLGHPNS